MSSFLTLISFSRRNPWSSCSWSERRHRIPARHSVLGMPPSLEGAFFLYPSLCIQEQGMSGTAPNPKVCYSHALTEMDFSMAESL